MAELVTNLEVLHEYGENSLFGVNFEFFKVFIAKYHSNMFHNMTTSEVWEHIVKPVTQDSALSYCSLYQAQDKNIGRAQVMICHDWRFPFTGLITQLQTHFKEDPDIVLWVDIFSFNFHIHNLDNDHKAIQHYCNEIIHRIGDAVCVLEVWLDDAVDLPPPCYTAAIMWRDPDRSQYSLKITERENLLNRSIILELAIDDSSNTVLEHDRERIRSSSSDVSELLTTISCNT